MWAYIWYKIRVLVLFAWKRKILSPLNFLGTFVKSKWLYISGSISGLCSVSLICCSFPLPIPHCLDACSFTVSLGIGWCYPSNFILFQKNFSSFSSFAFQINFTIYLPGNIKKFCWDIDWNCIKSVDQLGKNWHFYCFLQSMNTVSLCI